MTSECRRSGCTNPPVGFRGFCSKRCEVKFEHIRADARDAQRAARQEDHADPR